MCELREELAEVVTKNTQVLDVFLAPRETTIW